MKRARILLGSLLSLAIKVRASVWMLPIAKVLLAVGGIALFALLGRSALARAEVAPITNDAPLTSASPSASIADLAQVSAPFALAASSAPVGARGDSPLPSSPPIAPASPTDPVILNTATESDLRRLPGIGPKKATAILALRQRLGRFHQIDDLLRVKGIGRTTLKRLRPLVRLDAPPIADDAGAPQ